MKKTIVLMAIAGAFICSDSTAQKLNRGTDSAQRYVLQRQPVQRMKTLDDGTTGVLYQDTIRSSEKGDHRNLNYNRNVDLPPTDGGISNKND